MVLRDRWKPAALPTGTTGYGRGTQAVIQPIQPVMTTQVPLQQAQRAQRQQLNARSGADQ